ncbi:CynX/NimT family MFS transporter [Amycolatopsis jejuensis]|uniref:MFS transporter n=1 Tax=Amycolatopsis jejuensis TaxID=330084 RepID=UPI000525CE22|nr:MFS transporter [Amycolatopsis jejuensis]
MNARHSAVAVLMTAGVVAAMQVGKASSALPFVARDLQLTLAQSSWVVAMFSVLGAAVGVVVGRIADSFGRRRVVLAGLALVSVASAAGAFAPDGAVLLATRAAEGAGFLLVSVATPGLVTHAVAPPARSLILGSWPAAMPVGSSVMLVIGPTISTGVGWRWLWLLCSALTMCCVLAVALVVRPDGPRSPMPTSVFAGISRCFRSPGLGALAVAGAAYSAQFIGLLALLPALLDRLGIPAEAAGWLTAGAFLANIPGSVLGGVLQRNGRSRGFVVIVASVLMTGAAAIASADGPPGLVRYGAILVFSAAGGLIPSIVTAGVPRYVPDPADLSTAMGFASQGITIGQLAGPPLVASAVAGGHPPALVLGAAAAIAAGAGVVLRRLEVTGRSGPPPARYARGSPSRRATRPPGDPVR